LDIISNKLGVAILDNIKDTLMELITKNFLDSNKKRNKTKSIKANKKIKTSSNIVKSSPKFSISAFLAANIKEAKTNDKESKETKDLEEVSEDASKEVKGKKEIKVNGGYGTISKSYGSSQSAKYADYNKLFSHLGTFKTKGMYEEFSDPVSDIVNGKVETTREMVNVETMDKAAKFEKYFMAGEQLTNIGFVPPVGANVNSKDWEKYRVMSQMSIYQPIIALKRITA
jgi:hypothetical protein